MANQGMLSGLFASSARDLREEELAEMRRQQEMGRLDFFEAGAQAAYGGAELAGKGLGHAVGNAAGYDTRSAIKKQGDAVAAAKAEVSKLGLDPDDPKTIDQFYRQVIIILQKQGLAAEALEVGKEYQAQKLARSKDELAVREGQRKEAKDIASDTRSQERNEIARARLGTQGPETIQLLTLLDQTTDPNTRAAITKRLNALAAGKGVRFEDLGGTVQVVDALTGDVIRIDTVTAKPETVKDAKKDKDAKGNAAAAYAEYAAGLQRQYNAAVDLHNHAGVEGITGRWSRWVGEAGAFAQVATAFSSDDAGEALALYKQVQGGAFLAGLAKLKAASKTGASGLGAVSEKEGDKVQSDGAALDRLQQAPAFRRQLGIYIAEMEGFGQRLAAAAQGDGITPAPLAKKALTAPQRGSSAPQPAAAPTGGKTTRRKFNPVTGKVE